MCKRKTQKGGGGRWGPPDLPPREKTDRQTEGDRQTDRGRPGEGERKERRKSRGKEVVGEGEGGGDAFLS